MTLETTQNYHILLIEDDIELATLTSDYLRKHGFSVTLETDGGKAVGRIISEQADCVLLDIMLPNKDGFAICREARTAYNGLILMLTARDEDIDQLLGLELGADDYVCKPVQPRLLLARIHALLRRSSVSASTEPADPSASDMRFNNLHIQAGCRTVTAFDQMIDLTTAEYELLYLLAQHAGQVLSRDDILQHLRGIGYDGADRSIDLRISRLRKKLNDSQRIKTVRGSGYLFSSDSFSSASQTAENS